MMELYCNTPVSELPAHISEVEHMTRWMYFASGSIPAAYVQLVCNPSLSFGNNPDSGKKILEKVSSAEYIAEQERLKQECVDISKKVVAEHMRLVFSGKVQL